MNIPGVHAIDNHAAAASPTREGASAGTRSKGRQAGTAARSVGLRLARRLFVLQYRDMSASSLGTFELTVLLAVARLGDDAYGLAVRRDVSERMRRDYSVGAVYTTLQRLEDKGLISSRATEPLPIRGGRSRRQFKVTAAGHRSIREAQRVAASAWAGVRSPIKPEPA
jgi:DNA-binding PadR family transcriptional regulator